jgi:hypothetical protein
MTGDYTIVQLQRQDDLTRAIQVRMADTQKKQEEKANEQAESVAAA